VMVRMLEALDVRSTHTVLEIGTGTAYNAALLATLAQQVTSIDIESTFITQAKLHLAEMHLENVSVFTQNGILGYPAQSPYDRILVTASAPTIPMAWIDQLAPNGKIVCDFDGGFEHAFLIIEKDHTGNISGSIRPEHLHFMPMYGEMLPEYRRMHIPTLPVLSDLRPSDDIHLFMRDLQETRSFRWFLQSAQPGITMQQIHSANKQVIRVIAPDRQSYVTFLKENGTASWQEEVHANTTGEPTVRDMLFVIYKRWKKLEEPPVEDYTFCFSNHQPALRYATAIFPMLSLSTEEKFS
jgi:protein-L-isoaspartate O-methyltransferase